MKHLVFLLVMIISVSGLHAQQEEVLSKKELRSIAKEEKKARKMAEQEQMKELTEIMLKFHRFVLEADYVGDGRGQRIPVNSTINFAAVDSASATLQLGTPYGSGYNGVGGITVDGRVTKYDLKEIQGKKSKSYSLMIVIMTSLGSYDLTFMISETGLADLTVRGNTMGQLNYSGNLVPVGVSRVYKGSTLY